MRRSVTAVLSSALALFVAGCICEEGSGDLVEESRSMPEFQRLRVDVPGTVTMVQGAPAPLKIRTDDNLIDQVRTSVRDGALVIDTRSGDCIDPTELEIQVSSEEIRGLAIDGSGDIILPEPIDSDEVKLEIDGSGSISAALVRADEVKLEIDGSGEIDLSVDTLDLRSSIDGSGDIILDGTAVEHAIFIDGSGEIAATALQTEVTRVEVDGSGDCAVAADRDLEVRIDGSGEITYCGDPEIVRSIDGSGSVRRASAASCE
jgi:hypothetical protein